MNHKETRENVYQIQLVQDGARKVLHDYGNEQPGSKIVWNFLNR
jgi:hypothetical protein